MIPVTYPSSVSTSKESQMVVFALPSVAGLKRWTDYIPVKLQATGADIANSFNTNGYIACDFLQSTASKQAWVDYIPVFVDNAATTAWQVSDTGFIPFNTLAGGGLYYLGPSLDLNFVGSLSNPLFSSTAEDYTLNTNFLSLFYQVEAQYSVQGPTGIEQKNFADIVTFTRASTATYFNSAGTLTTAAINEARFDYNPSTLAAQGLLIEEQRTNSIRNNTMQGAVAGTPGTLPTNWTSASAGGISREVVGTGTSNGINYVDLRVFGTTTNTNLALNLYFELATQIAALTGQTWSESVWVQMVGGSTAGISQIYLAMVEISSGGADLAYLSGTDFKSTIGTFTRRTYTVTTSNASTAFIRPALWVSHTGIGAAIDITLRIGLPQLELGAFATSVIPTTTTALTRSADVASVNTLSPWFNATEGTLYAEITASANANTVYAALNNGTITQNSTYFDNDSGVIRNVVFSSSSAQAAMSTGAIGTVGAVNKIAGAYAVNNFAVSRNGGSAVTDTSGAVPVSVSQLDLGRNPSGLAVTYISGYLRRIVYYPRRLTNADLQTITA